MDEKNFDKIFFVLIKNNFEKSLNKNVDKKLLILNQLGHNYIKNNGAIVNKANGQGKFGKEWKKKFVWKTYLNFFLIFMEI